MKSNVWDGSAEIRGSAVGDRQKPAFKLLDLFVVTSLAAICTREWVIEQDRGWVAVIVSLSLIAYGLNRFRSRFAPEVSTLFLLPLIALAMFGAALFFGLRHPPIIAPTDWQWPAFSSGEERLVHAFALSLWTFVFGAPTMLLCGIVRRVIDKSK